MEKVTLTIKEHKRLKVVEEVIGKHLTGEKAAKLLGLSLRQMRRIIKTYRMEGAAGLAHGNRGKPSTRQIFPEVKAQVLQLAQKEYLDYNDQHFTEVLAATFGLVLSRSTVRRLRREAGLGTPHKHRPPRHRQRRERYEQRGMLLQMDGSDHAWLEERGPKLTLLAAIDDATGEVVGALFREQEDTAGYMLLLWQISRHYGLPMAIYADRHSIFQSPKEATIDQQLSGAIPRTQLGRALHQLDVELILAQSPQAKGRIERLFGTLQDRLVKALRACQASTMEEANTMLPDFFAAFNCRFAVSPPQPASAFRPWPANLKPDQVFCLKHTRRVANDNAISFDGHRLQIPPGTRRLSYARDLVEVQQHLDGTLSIHYQDTHLVTFLPASDSWPVRVGHFTPAKIVPSTLPSPDPIDISSVPEPKPPRQPTKPKPDHPWRHAFYSRPKNVQK